MCVRTHAPCTAPLWPGAGALAKHLQEQGGIDRMPVLVSPLWPIRVSRVRRSKAIICSSSTMRMRAGLGIVRHPQLLAYSDATTDPRGFMNAGAALNLHFRGPKPGIIFWDDCRCFPAPLHRSSAAAPPKAVPHHKRASLPAISFRMSAPLQAPRFERPQRREVPEGVAQ